MRLRPEYLDSAAQADLLAEIAEVLRQAPLVRPEMPRTGKPFSVMMSNCGALGWVSDRSGYRYQAHHPVTGAAWPAIPQRLVDIWQDLSGADRPAEACLINHYEAGARMGLHQDRDEADFDAPVVSLSLGDTAVFRIGGAKRKDPTRSLRLASGDAVVLEHESRLAFHGIDRVVGGSSTLLDGYQDLFANRGRVNITMRVVTPRNRA